MKRKNLSEDDLDRLFSHLSESVQGPAGKYTADETYPELRKKLFAQPGKRYQLFKYAAAASIVLVVCLSAYFYLSGQPEMIAVITTDRVQDVTLPDGSRVTLNHYSSLEYPSKFRTEKRDVTLSGEGYFDVVKDNAHPFVVHADKVNVEVLGTQFNVQSFPGDKYVKTTLLEGSVAVRNTLNNNATVLIPNESAIYCKATGSLDKKMEAAAQDEISWREDKLVFNNKSLGEITEDLSNYFNRKIEIDNPDLKAYKLAAVFERGEKLDEILNVLQSAANFSRREADGTIIITPGK